IIRDTAVRVLSCCTGSRRSMATAKHRASETPCPGPWPPRLLVGNRAVRQAFLRFPESLGHSCVALLPHVPAAKCCTSMIVSPFVLDRNVPLIGPPRGGQIGADGDEQGGVAKSRGAGARTESAAACGGCSAADARELSAGKAPVETLPGGRCFGPAAPQRRAALESRSRREV